MKVDIIRNVMVAGVRKDSGSTIEVEDHVGHMLIGIGKAVKAAEVCEPVKKPAAKKAVAKPKTTPADE